MNFSLKSLFSRQSKPAIRAATPASAPSPFQFVIPSARSRWMGAGISFYTPQQVEYVFRNALAGDLVSQWEMFDLMEATWPELSQCLNELKDSVVNVEFEVVPFKLRNTAATPEAERRAKLVEEVLWSMSPDPAADENNMERTMRDLLDARGKGISVCEIEWSPRMTSVGPALGPRATRWVHPSWYGYGPDSSTLMLRTSAQTFGAPSTTTQPGQLVPFPPNKFLIGVCKNKTGHPLGSAMLHVLGFWWSAANFTADAFFDLAQIFGQPIRWANYDPGMGSGDRAKLQAMLENMGRSSWGMFPEGVTLELKEAMKSATDNPQKVLLDTANKVCRLVVLRQTLTSDVGDSGSRALGDVHQETKAGVELACAKWTCETLQQLVRSICIINFGNDQAIPYLKPCDAEEDPKALAEVLATAKNAGLEPTDEELPDLGERLGFDIQRATPPPAPTAFGFQPREPFPQREGALQEQDDESVEAAQARVATQLGVPPSWLNPLTEFLREIEIKCRDSKLSDVDLQNFLISAANRVPELFGKMNVAELADVFEAAMGQEVLQAARRGIRKHDAKASS